MGDDMNWQPLEFHGAMVLASQQSQQGSRGFKQPGKAAL